LQSIAAGAGIGAWLLIEFNFLTSDPAEVNWYLKNYLKCAKETADHRNFVFSGGESIYIPDFEPIEVKARRPVPPCPLVLTKSSTGTRTSTGTATSTRSGGAPPRLGGCCDPTFTGASPAEVTFLLGHRPRRATACAVPSASWTCTRTAR
jgi:hypothetical protein